MKFGGSSIADADCIRRVAEIVRGSVARRPVVVLSALFEVTDLLTQAVDVAQGGDREALEPLLADLERRHRWALGGTVEDADRRHRVNLEIDRLFDELRQRLRSIRILGEATPRATDGVLALGERMSSQILAEAFCDAGLAAVHVDAREVVITDERYGAAVPDLAALGQRCVEILAPIAAGEQIPVLGGFIGRSAGGETTTLGRGGSDTTAAVLGSGLAVEEIQIWTDVDGLMSADPRLVAAARNLVCVSFAEAAELAAFGARVLHPDAIVPAVSSRIPVRVLNSLRPDAPGTVIVDGDEASGTAVPVAVASRSRVSVIRVRSPRMRRDSGLTRRLLEACNAAGGRPQFVVGSEIGASIAVADSGDHDALRGALGAFEPEFLDDCAIVGVVGSRLAVDARLRSEVLSVLARWDPELIGFGASNVSVAAVVRRSFLDGAVKELHRRFFEEVTP